MDTGIRYHDCVDTWEGLHILMKYFSLVFFISIFLFPFFFFSRKFLLIFKTRKNFQKKSGASLQSWAFTHDPREKTIAFLS